MVNKIILWGLKNKLVLLFGLLTLCLSISTLALSVTDTSAHRYPKTQIEDHLLYNINNKTSVDDTHEVDYYRLPKTVMPKSYELTLSPNFTNKTFKGSVRINILVIHDTNTISVHAKDIIIKLVTLKNRNNITIPIEATMMVPDKRERLTIILKQKIHKGHYDLEISFTGDLTKKNVGFYASNLKNNNIMVASKFQPTYARQAFPCFDEPDFKATYDISLVKPISYTALSNMNEISKTIDPKTNLEIVSFATSVPMSTYLACFVICDFDFKETEINSNGVGKNFKMRSFATKGETHKIEFAQYIGKKATEFYIKYYEVPYPLPKLDMIAIPDYVSGATEHWGLITYRETSFLVDEATASTSNKISVANTIAHELAHMWFGNLVTMKWWDEVWLNEGFASYMQVKSLNAIEPSWTMLDQFLIKTLHSVLVTDAKLSSHPIVQNVQTPDQITAIFDTISYNKGASILRMLEGFIGEENFRLGVSDYLKKYAFGNTITKDLLGSLEPYFNKDNPDLNLSHIIDTWTRQMGYPVLTIKLGDEPNTYVITQSRFLLDFEAVYDNDSPYNYKWFIPITYKTNNGLGENILWFSDSANNVTLKVGDNVDWIKINNNQVGYYRVNYTIDMWRKLIILLHTKPKKLTISDRAQLLNDAFALAEAQMLPYELALNLIKYISVEEDFVPWQTASTILNTLAERLVNTSAYDNLKDFVQRLIKPIYVKQNWEIKDIGIIDGLLRSRILSLATRYNLPEAENSVKNIFMNWLNNRETSNAVEIQPDLRDFVYYYGMKSASQTEWDKLWGIYLQEKDVQESTKIRNALSAPRDTTILKRYLTLAWDEGNIRSQDYLTVVSHISDNPSGTALAWNGVRTRWPELVDRFTLNSRYLGNLIPAITSNFNTEEKLKEMEAFFKKYPEAGAGESARTRSLETVRNNLRWTRTNEAQVAQWLQKNQA